jgi:hypothetical protein
MSSMSNIQRHGSTIRPNGTSPTMVVQHNAKTVMVTKCCELMSGKHLSQFDLNLSRFAGQIIGVFGLLVQQQSMVEIWYDDIKKGQWSFAQLGLPVDGTTAIYTGWTDLLTIDAPLDGSLLPLKPPSSSYTPMVGFNAPRETAVIDGIVYPVAIKEHPPSDQVDITLGSHLPPATRSGLRSDSRTAS